MKDCERALPPAAIEGIRLFNTGHFFEAHEALEAAWKGEPGPVRDLYRGVLQIAVTYLHISRNNYDGAIKVFARSQRWLKPWPEICQGIHVGQLKRDAEAAMREVERLGRGKLATFDPSLFKSITLDLPETEAPVSKKRLFICDRCGAEMFENNCKVTCPNCGNQFDCSDLNLYFD